MFNNLIDLLVKLYKKIAVTESPNRWGFRLECYFL